ncbi:MAG: hypothetical protein ACRDRS_17905 [Pseudonocardiaceae bacterium]
MPDLPGGTPSGWDPFSGDVGPGPRRGPLARAAAPVLRIGPLRWLTAELIPLGCLGIGALITWLRPDYALVGLMIGIMAAPVLGFIYLYKTLGASVWWVLPLVLGTMAVSIFGVVAIPGMLLEHRGHPTEVVVDNVMRQPGGIRDCTFARRDGTPIPDSLRGCDPGTKLGDRTTLVLDPLGQIAPVSAPFHASPVASPVIGVLSVGLLVLVVAGAVANGEYWIRRHPKAWTLYERLMTQRGTAAHLWLRR